jgi:hypothetical protein
MTQKSVLLHTWYITRSLESSKGIMNCFLNCPLKLHLNTLPLHSVTIQWLIKYCIICKVSTLSWLILNCTSIRKVLIYCDNLMNIPYEVNLLWSISWSKPKRGVSNCFAYMYPHKISYCPYILISVLLFTATARHNNQLMHPMHGIDRKTVMVLQNEKWTSIFHVGLKSSSLRRQY